MHKFSSLKSPNKENLRTVGCQHASVNNETNSKMMDMLIAIELRPKKNGVQMLKSICNLWRETTPKRLEN
jgi:hypothetical protein